uniref:Uncharacterized protein n=1 Tax=Arundo donax TaxID=35708 RepID=A0A0A9CK28_ARUDO
MFKLFDAYPNLFETERLCCCCCRCCCSLFLSPSLCWFLWVSSLAYPNLLGTKGFVVVVVVVDIYTYTI